MNALSDFAALRVRNRSKYLKLRLRAARDETGRHRGFNAVETPRIRNDDALHVLHDVAGDFNVDRLREAAEALSGFSGGISERNGFGAAHCGKKFLEKRFAVGSV